MKIFSISNRGLIVIAFLVAVLWGLIYTERSLTLRAQRDYQEVMRSLTVTPAKAQPIPARKPVFPVRPAQV